MFDSRITALEQKMEHVHQAVHYMEGQVSVILHLHQRDSIIAALTHRLKMSTDALSKSIKCNQPLERS